MHSFLQDVRYGLRMLGRSPSFTALAILTLALGIGASTAIFSAVNALVLRPLPGDGNDRLLAVAFRDPRDADSHKMSYLDYKDFQQQSVSFADLTAYDLRFGVLTADGRSDQILVSHVPGNFFSVLGMQPAVGRLFDPEEGDRRDTVQGVVLGYSYWQERFGGNPRVVGKLLTLKGRATTILGVAPKELVGPFTPIETGAYLPIEMMPETAEGSNFFTDRSDRELYVLAKPKSGASRFQVRASLQVIADRLGQEFPATNKGMVVNVLLERLARPDTSDSTGTLLAAGMFLAMVALLLTIACADVTNLLLVRASSRSREMAVRASLGAGRLRLLRQMMTENLILSGLGGIAGAVLGWWLSRLIGAIRLPTGIPIRVNAAFDWRVFACIAIVVILCAALVGIAPALRTFRADLNTVMRDGGRSSSAGAQRSRFRGALIVAQVAGSLVALVAGALFLRSLMSAEKMDLGFRPDGLLNLTINVTERGYDEARGIELFRALKDRIRGLAGVESATLASAVPMSQYLQEDRIWKEGTERIPENQAPEMNFNTVDEEYFRTLEIPILRGRVFTRDDRKDTRRVAVINETMAQLFWSGQDSIGQRFRVGKPDGPPIEVVGVARDGKYASLFEQPRPSFYLSLAQNYSPLRILQVRTSRPPPNLATLIEKNIYELEPDLPVFDVMTMEQSLGGPNGFFLLRIGSTLAGLLGVLCLALAVVGIYGVMSYVTTQRTYEIGVRMALGAQRGDVLGLIARQGARLTIAGVAIGLAGAFALTRLMSSLLFGISAYDPLAFVSCIVLLAIVAGLACWIPARRATRLDPTAALRYE
jgi:macrolide transport system ATP-binding/permease protein